MCLRLCVCLWGTILKLSVSRPDFAPVLQTSIPVQVPPAQPRLDVPQATQINRPNHVYHPFLPSQTHSLTRWMVSFSINGTTTHLLSQTGNLGSPLSHIAIWSPIRSPIQAWSVLHIFTSSAWPLGQAAVFLKYSRSLLMSFLACSSPIIHTPFPLPSPPCP